jgi:seryl-tRNA synthetase
VEASTIPGKNSKCIRNQIFSLKACSQVDNLRAEFGKLNKEIAQKKKAKEDADDLIAQSKGYDEKIKNAEAACDALILRRDDILKKIGNLVHDSVPISDNEDLNAIVRADGLDRVLPADKIKEFKTVKVCDCPCPYPVFKGLSTVNP